MPVEYSANHVKHTQPHYGDPSLNWLSACQWLAENGEAYCIATVVAEVGSVPRANGAKMVISRTAQFDTLGGGALEQRVIKHARQQLKEKQANVSLERFALAADLGQCCGGAVQVMFEYINTQQPKVVIYGAGHVSLALCTILKALPCHVSVIDSRPEWCEQITELGVQSHCIADPTASISELTRNSLVVIMTHDHQLDFSLTEAALKRNGLAFIGLIGSQGKRHRFEFRLKEQLADPSRLNQLICPIGHPDIRGKLPMQVAVSIAAQLMAHFDQLSDQTPSTQTPSSQENGDQPAQWQRANMLRAALRSEARGANCEGAAPLEAH